MHWTRSIPIVLCLVSSTGSPPTYLWPAAVWLAIGLWVFRDLLIAIELRYRRVAFQQHWEREGSDSGRSALLDVDAFVAERQHRSFGILVLACLSGNLLVSVLTSIGVVAYTLLRRKESPGSAAPSATVRVLLMPLTVQTAGYLVFRTGGRVRRLVAFVSFWMPLLLLWANQLYLPLLNRDIQDVVLRTLVEALGLIPLLWGLVWLWNQSTSTKPLPADASIEELERVARGLRTG